MPYDNNEKRQLEAETKKFMVLREKGFPDAKTVSYSNKSLKLLFHAILQCQLEIFFNSIIQKRMNYNLKYRQLFKKSQTFSRTRCKKAKKHSLIIYIYIYYFCKYKDYFCKNLRKFSPVYIET